MPIKPNEVVLIDPQGNRRVFDRNTEAQLALRQGYRNETREEYDERRTKEGLSSPVEQVKSFVAGAARGATFGISDVVLSRADERAREGLALRKEVSPGVSVAGEIAGALVGTKAGAGKALAKGAESLATRATGGVTSSLLRKTLKTALAEGTEGAAYGLGQAISEEALDSDPGINAERLIANVGVGGLIGGGAGGLLGLAGGAAAKAGKAIRGGEGATSNTWLRDTIEKYTKKSASKALGGEPEAFKKLAKKSRTFEEVIDDLGDFLSKEKTADGKFLINKWDNPEKIYDKIRTYRKTVGKQIGDYHRGLYEQSGKRGVALDNFMDEAQRLISKHKDSLVPEVKERTNRLRSFINDVEGTEVTTSQSLILDNKGNPIIQGGTEFVPRKMSLEQVDRLREEIDSVVFPRSKPGTGIVVASPMQEEFLILARKLQDDIVEHVAKLADNAGVEGKEIVMVYRDLNKKFSYLSNAEKIAERGVMRGFSNRAFSPSDYLTSIGGVAGGAAAFGPMGIPLGIGVGVVNKILRERSRATMTAIGRWALTKENALASTVRTQAKIEKAARGLVKHIKPKPGLLAGITYAKATKRPREEEIKEYRKAQDSITRLVSNPQNLMDDMRERTAALSDAMPNLGQASQAKMVEIMEYLAGKMPPENPIDPLRPRMDTAPAIQDVRRFMALVEVANDPTAVLERMSEGRLPTVDEMEFLRTCFPMIAQDITKALTEALERNKGELGYQQRLNISLLMGIAPQVTPQTEVSQQEAQQEEQQKKDEFKLTASASKQLGKSIEKQSEGVVFN